MSELRALEMMRSVPEGCIAFPICDDSTEPHLKPGEFAIVDTNDRDPVVGELYVIERKWRSETERRREIVQVCRFAKSVFADGSSALYVGSYVPDQYIRGIGKTRMLDGGYPAESLKQLLIGRVVGIHDYAVQS